MLNPPGSPAAMSFCREFRPVALRPTLSDGLPFADDFPFGLTKSNSHAMAPQPAEVL
jgi:hypothetical protein